LGAVIGSGTPPPCGLRRRQGAQGIGAGRDLCKPSTAASSLFQDV